MEHLNFSFQLPTRIEFGEGVLSKTGKEAKQLGGSRVLLLTDPGILNSGLAAIVEESLKKEGIPCEIYSGVVANPRDVDIEAGASFAKKSGIDMIVAIGGGSVMDSAKAIGTLLTHGGHIGDYCGVQLLSRDITPLIVIPTTAGTGSEVTSFAVVTDTKRHLKHSIWDIKAMAKVALLDPSVLLSVPSHIAASTGMDALTHAIEAYTCRSAIPHTDAMALLAIQMIGKSLRDVVQNPDIHSCTNMMVGSNLAGIAIGFADVAGVHCMAEALGGRYDIPHGVANAMLLPVVTKYNALSNIEKYATITRQLGIDTVSMTDTEAALHCGVVLEQLCRALSIPSMKDFPIIDSSDFPDLAQAAFKNTSNGSNPRSMTANDYLTLFEEAYRN